MSFMWRTGRLGGNSSAPLPNITKLTATCSNLCPHWGQFSLMIAEGPSLSLFPPPDEPKALGAIGASRYVEGLHR